MAKSKSVAAIPKSARELVRRRQAAEAQMTAPLLDKVGPVREMLVEATTGSLQRVWNLGGIIHEVADDEAQYGQKAVHWLAEAIGYDSKSYLQQALHFHRDFSEEELAALLKMRTRYGGSPIGWNYVLKLLSVDDHRQRTRLLEAICENEWSLEQLGENIDKLRGVGRDDRHAGGRAVKVPPTSEGCLSNLEKIGGFFVRNTEAIYVHPAHGFLHRVQATPADRISPDLLEKIQSGIRIAVQLEESAARVRQELQDARALAESRMVRHAEEVATRGAEAIIGATNGKPKLLGHTKDEDKVGK